MTNQVGLKRANLLNLGIWVVLIPFYFGAIVSCQWDPQRDNPLHTGLAQPQGKLATQVRRLSGAPIAQAVVTIPQLGRFRTTNNDGWAVFEDLPHETLLVTASYTSPEGVAYASEDSQIVVTPFGSDTLVFSLDALPIFRRSQVNSVTIAEGDNEQTATITYRLSLTTAVDDPDGPQDLRKVQWNLYSNSQTDSILQRGDMSFRPDSALWWSDVPDSVLPGGRLDRVLTLPFLFRAEDLAGHGSLSRPAFLARVIHEVPKNLSLSVTGRNPTFDWDFIWDAVFRDTADFIYILRVWNNLRTRVIYEKLLTPSRFYTNRHTAQISFEAGRYYWEVWTVDIFGNRARSRQIAMQVL